MVKSNIIFIAIIIGVYSSITLAEESKPNGVDDLLAERCFAMLDIYKNKDMDAFLAYFPAKWLEINSKEKFEKLLDEKHESYMKSYQGSPTLLEIKGFESAIPQASEVAHLNVSEARIVRFRIEGDKSGANSNCKFNKIGDEWFLKKLPL